MLASRRVYQSEGRSRLGHLNQLHLAIAFAVKDLQSAEIIAKDKDLPVAKLSFFHGLLKGHCAKRN